MILRNYDAYDTDIDVITIEGKSAAFISLVIHLPCPVTSGYWWAMPTNRLGTIMSEVEQQIVRYVGVKCAAAPCCIGVGLRAVFMILVGKISRIEGTE